jgi:hypothetical protein
LLDPGLALIRSDSGCHARIHPLVADAAAEASPKYSCRYITPTPR